MIRHIILHVSVTVTAWVSVELFRLSREPPIHTLHNMKTLLARVLLADAQKYVLGLTELI